MPLGARDYVVATFSPQPSVADFLKRIVDAAGFAGQAASTCEELERLMEAVMPDALVYEIGFPFADNWRRLEEMRARPMFQRLPVVIASGDAHALYQRVGVPAIDLFRKPDDLTELRQAVLGAIQTAA